MVQFLDGSSHLAILRPAAPNFVIPSEPSAWQAVAAFLFGLLHGIGFAGALSDIGVPQNDVSLALLTFNPAVEIGQLLIIAVVLGIMALVRHIVGWVPLTLPAGAWHIAPYAIGSIAEFWTILRVMSLLPVDALARTLSEIG